MDKAWTTSRITEALGRSPSGVRRVRQHLRERGELQPGDVVVLDNLSSHKRADTWQLTEAADARLWFLPPYSPDLNPIENAFSKLRRLYESTSHRTVDALLCNIQALLDAIKSSDARGFFQHCGYVNAI